MCMVDFEVNNDGQPSMIQTGVFCLHMCIGYNRYIHNYILLCTCDETLDIRSDNMMCMVEVEVFEKDDSVIITLTLTIVVHFKLNNYNRHSFWPPSFSRSCYFYQRLSVALQRCNSNAFIRRAPAPLPAFEAA